MVYIHHSSVVVEISTIIFGAENCNQLFVLSEEPIPILHNLMASTNQVKVVFFQELL